MKRRILNTEATALIDNRVSGVRQTVKLQVLTNGTVFISTQQNDLQQLDATGAPVNGLRLANTSSIEDGTFHDFLGVLWARSDIGADVEVTIHNSPAQGPQKRALRTSYTPWNAPTFGRH